MSSTSSDSIAQLEVSHKTVEVRADDAALPPCSLHIRFKDFYILRAGECDYTGLRVWPGAEMLASFMHAAGLAGALTDLCGVELGAGVGLSGLVAARWMRRMILTDRVAVLQDLMAQNVELNGLQARAAVADLDWGVQGARALLRQYAVKQDDGPASTNVAAAAAASSASSTSAAAASPVAAAAAAVPAVPFAWDPSCACIIAADVVYPDTSDEALVALFQTVDTLLQLPLPADDPAAASAAAPSASAATAAPAAAPSVAASPFHGLPFPLRGSFLCAYLSRDSATSRRFLHAAAQAGFEARPVDQSMLQPAAAAGAEATTAVAAASTAAIHADAGVHPSAVVQFRKVASVAVRPETGLAEFMYLPALHRLWSPPLSRAQRALEELEELTEDNAFARLGGGDSEEDTN